MLYDITASAIGARAPGFYAPEQVAAWMQGRDAAQYEAVIAAGRVRVAEGGGLLGFVDTLPGVITRLFVRPEFMGRGVGRVLLEAGVAEAWSAEGVTLQATLHAVGFYARQGFVETGREVYAHPSGGLPVEVVAMRRTKLP